MYVCVCVWEALSHCGSLPHTVHRLDCDTSGAMVLAKTLKCAQDLGAACQQMPRVCCASVAAVCVGPHTERGDQIATPTRYIFALFMLTSCEESLTQFEAQFREALVDSQQQGHEVAGGFRQEAFVKKLWFMVQTNVAFVVARRE